MKKTLIVLLSMTFVFGIAVALAHADFYPSSKTFTVANVRVVRFTDTDNNNNCYVVLSTSAEAMNTISCVAGTVAPIK